MRLEAARDPVDFERDLTMSTSRRSLHGRGTPLTPANRFEVRYAEPDEEHRDPEDEEWEPWPQTVFLDDTTRSVVNENNSPDIPFSYSLNPYRGCEHGCTYCYARPGHEYLGFNAGVDFESKIVVKRDAPALFREWLSRKSYAPEVVILSGVTDCYQPAERRFRITRGCVEVAAEAGQPLSIITKNALVCRDLDLLREMAARRLVHVNVSITTLDPQLARVMEPRTSSPAARLRAVSELSAAGVPVRVMVAPIVPGLTDNEMPAILKAAANAGASDARFTLVRLPLAVAPIFLDWLRRTQPLKAEKIEGQIRQISKGKLNRTEWGRRTSGTGLLATQIAELFKTLSRRYGIGNGLPEHNVEEFRPPRGASGQMRLF